jgi:hypothetical protein
MLSTHPQLGLPSGLYPSGLPTNIQYAFLFSPFRAICPAHTEHIYSKTWEQNLQLLNAYIKMGLVLSTYSIKLTAELLHTAVKVACQSVISPQNLAFFFTSWQHWSFA